MQPYTVLQNHASFSELSWNSWFEFLSVVSFFFFFFDLFWWTRLCLPLSASCAIILFHLVWPLMARIFAYIHFIRRMFYKFSWNNLLKGCLLNIVQNNLVNDHYFQKWFFLQKKQSIY